MASFNRTTDSSDPIVTIANGGDSTWLVNNTGDIKLPLKPRRKPWWRRWMQFFTIEPLTFLYGISSVVAVVYLNEQTKLRICEHELGYNATICNLVGQSSSKDHPGLDEVNAKVQKRWVIWVLYQHLVSCIPGAIITAFAGAWSDNFGRKPPMILVLIGISISSIIGLVFVAVKTAPLYVTLIYALFQSLFGNWSVMLMCIVSYIADVSSDATRTVRIAVAESGIGVGAVFGAIIASILIQTRIPEATMVISLALYLVSLAIVIFAVRETRKKPASVRERMAARYPGAVVKPNVASKFLMALSQLFTLNNLRDAYATATRPRPHHIRLYIALCAFAMFLFTIQMTGEQEVIQEYFEFPPLSWTYSQYQHYVSGFGVVEMVAVFGVFFLVSGYFHVRDTIVMIIGASSCFARALIMLGARTNTMVYVASSIGLFKYIGSISFRVCVSKLVERDEQARGFALIACAETLAPVVGSVLYAYMLTSGVDWNWTNAVFLVSAVDTGLRLLVGIIVCVGTWSFYRTYSADTKPGIENRSVAGSPTTTVPITGPIYQQQSHQRRGSVSGKALHDLIVSGGQTNAEFSEPSRPYDNTFLEPRIDFATKSGNFLGEERPYTPRPQKRTDGDTAPSTFISDGEIDDVAAADAYGDGEGPTPATALGGVGLNAVTNAGDAVGDSDEGDEPNTLPPRLRNGAPPNERASSFVTEYSIDSAPTDEAEAAARVPRVGDEARNFNERQI